MPARLERGAARFGPASASPFLARTVGLGVAGFVLAAADLPADLLAGLSVDFGLAADLDDAAGRGLVVVILTAGRRAAGFFFATLVLPAGFAVLLAGFTVLLTGLTVLAVVFVLAGLALRLAGFALAALVFLAAGLGFAALLRAAVFLAGAFSGLVLFPEAERH